MDILTVFLVQVALKLKLINKKVGLLKGISQSGNKALLLAFKSRNYSSFKSIIR